MCRVPGSIAIEMYVNSSYLEGHTRRNLNHANVKIQHIYAHIYVHVGSGEQPDFHFTTSHFLQNRQNLTLNRQEITDINLRKMEVLPTHTNKQMKKP